MIILSEKNATSEYIDLGRRPRGANRPRKRSPRSQIPPISWRIDGTTRHHLRTVTKWSHDVVYYVGPPACFAAQTHRIPPGFRDLERPGGPSKSMYSKIADDSESSDRDCHYASCRPWAPELSRFRQLRGLSAEGARGRHLVWPPLACASACSLHGGKACPLSEFLMYCPKSRLMPGIAGFGRGYPDLGRE